MLVGAGSVRRAEQFAEVRDAGADFVVSPGHTDALVNAAHDAGLPFVPGASTPSEMISLLEKGYRLQKFFPAEVAGGIGMLKSVASPIPEARFMPTGGITPDTAPQFLALPNVAAIGGSWIAPAKLVAARDFETIGRLAADAMSLGV
jgi:2-dehydro-3-deoxyphosphogluconate aldolase/(4S)-4-hydroxy-2-oxoglutarate aldolase